MTLKEIESKLYMDHVFTAPNPFHVFNPYEEKGMIVCIKQKAGQAFDRSILSSFCYQCPDLDHHPSIEKMVLFSYDQNNVITTYTIGATQSKIIRSDVLKYESLIQKTWQ